MWRRKRRTKIVGTLGPACSGKVLEQLVEAGLDVARLNFSHGTQAEHGAWIKKIRRISSRRGQPVAVLQDLAGPKMRLGDVPGGQLELRKGQELIISLKPGAASRAVVTVPYPEIITDTPVGVPILLADGRVEVKVERKTSEALYCRVLNDGWLTSQAGINFPHHTLSIPAFTSKDQEDLRFGVAMEVDYVALSYVRGPQDVLEVRNFLEDLGGEQAIIAKIEKHEALSQLEDILAVSDGVMVARGDLGLEVPLERVPLIQKQIIAAANRVGKPVITATQMLLSMVDSPRPSRAEATDAANAILDGTDAVMLSEETAVGHFPVAAVKFLNQISLTVEAQFPHERWLRKTSGAAEGDISEAISRAACELAHDLKAAAILTSTDYGGTARHISRFRPEAPIIGVTPRPSTWRRLALVWGVFPLLVPRFENLDHMLKVVKEEALRAGWLKAGDKVVITAGTPLGQRGTTDLIKAEIV